VLFNGADTGITFRRRKDSPTGACASLHHRKALSRSATYAKPGAPKTHMDSEAVTRGNTKPESLA
jgi:hypothetical protein